MPGKEADRLPSPKATGGFISYLAKPCPCANFLRRAWGFLGNPLFCLFSEGTRQSGREGSLQRFTSLPLLLGLSLRHPEKIKVVSRKRSFRGTLLKQLNGE